MSDQQDRNSMVLKAATIASSALLAVGVISYRAGAFDVFRGPMQTTQASGSQATASPARPERTFMSGTKSKVIKVVPDAPPVAQQPSSPVPSPARSVSQPKSKAFLPGSKSLGPIPVVKPGQLQQQQAGPGQVRP